MPKMGHSEEQIIAALKQCEGGEKTADICRRLGISQATFYMWKKQYAGLGLQELRELRQLCGENGRLKRLVADLSLDRQILQEVVSKNAWSAAPLQAKCTISGSSLRKCIRPLVDEILAIMRIRAHPLFQTGSALMDRFFDQVCGAPFRLFLHRSFAKQTRWDFNAKFIGRRPALQLGTAYLSLTPPTRFGPACLPTRQ